MRWVTALIAIFVTVLMIGQWTGANIESSRVDAIDVLAASAAEATEFLQRHQSKGIECTACHGAQPDFTLVPPMGTCLSCHGSYEELAEQTADIIPNPHHSHMGEVTCTNCHSEHQESKVSCNQCHIFEMDVP